MLRRNGMLSWLAAMASFAMMLAVQLSHSPLHHCGQGAGQCTGNSCAIELPGHSHEHAAGHAHSHSTCGHHHHGAAQSRQSQGERHSPAKNCPADSHENCHLCQFLLQAMQPVGLPVELPVFISLESVPPTGASAVATVELAGPYVRGPPLIA